MVPSSAGSAGYADNNPDAQFIPPDLLRKAFAGDGAAKERLWEAILAFLEKSANICCPKYGIGFHERQDVVQDALHAIIRQPYEKLREIENWPGWLYRVCARCASSKARRRKRRETKGKMYSLDATFATDGDDRAGSLADVLPHAEDVLQQVAYNELVSEIESFCESLPKDKARIFRLFLGGHSYKDIEQQTGVPGNSVGVVIYRAKKSLAVWLDKRCSGSEA